MTVRRTKYLSKQGPRNRLRRAAGAGLRDAALLRTVRACIAGSEPRHTAPSGGRERHAVRDRGGDIPSRGRGTDFAGPQAQRPPRGAPFDTSGRTELRARVGAL